MFGYFLLVPILTRYITESHFLEKPSVGKDNLQKCLVSTPFTAKNIAYYLTDRLCWFAVIGSVVGARLGAVFFYDWPLFREHPEEIIKVWHGGLASHGGILGLILAIYLYILSIRKWFSDLSFLRLCDFVIIPTTLAVCFIRLGNMMNQEILGTPTNLPWGIIFGHPADGSLPTPRHPVQLYEAIAYFIVFLILYCYWKKQSPDAKPGSILGLGLVLGFSCRLFLEFWKTDQPSSMLSSSFLQMGQVLSIPFILFGLYLLWRGRKSRKSSGCN